MLADVGDPDAIARGAVRIRPAADRRLPIRPRHDRGVDARRRPLRPHRLRPRRAHGRRSATATLLASTLPTPLAAAAAARLPDHGTVTLGGIEYTAATFHAQDFGGRPTTVVVLTDTSAAAGAATRGQWIALGLLAAASCCSRSSARC